MKFGRGPGWKKRPPHRSRVGGSGGQRVAASTPFLAPHLRCHQSRPPEVRTAVAGRTPSSLDPGGCSGSQRHQRVGEGRIWCRRLWIRRCHGRIWGLTRRHHFQAWGLDGRPRQSAACSLQALGRLARRRLGIAALSRGLAPGLLRVQARLP
jgi:hypothetical protein